jgi:hypothetical protein
MNDPTPTPSGDHHEMIFVMVESHANGKRKCVTHCYSPLELQMMRDPVQLLGTRVLEQLNLLAQMTSTEH